MSRKAIKQELQIAQEQGWSVSRNQKNHFRLEHPDVDRVVIAPSTPSDFRSVLNLRAALRRVLKAPDDQQTSPDLEAGAQGSGDDALPADDSIASSDPRKIRKKPRPRQMSDGSLADFFEERLEERRSRSFARRAALAEHQNQSDPQEISYDHLELLRAWQFAVLRARTGGADWTVVRSLKERVLQDPLFRDGLVKSLRGSNPTFVAHLRATLRGEVPSASSLTYRRVEDQEVSPSTLESPGAVPAQGRSSPARAFVQSSLRDWSRQIGEMRGRAEAAELQVSELSVEVTRLTAELSRTESGTSARIAELEMALSELKMRRAYADRARDDAEANLALAREENKALQRSLREAELQLKQERTLRQSVEEKLARGGLHSQHRHVPGRPDAPVTHSGSSPGTSLASIPPVKAAAQPLPAPSATATLAITPDQSFSTRIGFLIKVIRSSAGMTQEDLGEKIGVSGSMISLIERGLANNASDHLANIAAALGVSATSLHQDPTLLSTASPGNSGRSASFDAQGKKDMSVGSRIHRKRIQLGLTQAELASATNASGPLVSQWENDRRHPGVDRLPLIARALQMNPEGLQE